MIKISLALIVRNEAACLTEIIPKIQKNLFHEVFAIDGNSTDDTISTLSKFNIESRLQSLPGLGAAMIEARKISTSDAIIFFHPDGNEDPNDLPLMCKLLQDGHQFVVASRMMAGGWNEEDSQIIKMRKWANLFFIFVANLFFAHGGNKTSDVTNGFRGIYLTAFDRLNLSSIDLTMDYQMIIRALKLNIFIKEFPTHEYPRIDGKTNFSSFPTGMAELKLLFREIFMGLRTAK